MSFRKFNEEEVLEIRRLYASNSKHHIPYSLRKLAKLYGCGVQTVYKIVTGRLYTDIGGPLHVPYGKFHVTEKQFNEIYRLFDIEGKCIDDIAVLMDFDFRTINRVLVTKEYKDLYKRRTS